MTEQYGTPQVILLGFAGCPNLAPARTALVAALRAAGQPEGGYTEYDTGTEDCPDALKCWPSPTILVNGKDVEGAAPGSAPEAGNACRVYDGNAGAPSARCIADALRECN